jgi:hypothetical protein
VIRSGDVGTGLAAAIAKEGGAHLVGEIRTEYLGRKFDANDLGFVPRSNLYRLRSALEYRELERHGPFLETHERLEYFQKYNLDGLDLGGGYHAQAFGKLSSFWNYWTQLLYHESYFDDREIGDGASMQRAPFIGYELWFETDRTKPVSFEWWNFGQRFSNAWAYTSEAGMLFRVLPALDLAILPTGSYTVGEPRFAGPSASGDYVFGELQAKSIGTTLRATYTFTPRLTLQAYGQFLLASGHYTNLTTYPRDPATPRPVVRLVDMRPFTGAIDNPDFVDGVLNVNVVFRWEYRLGSIAYLVYTRSQSPDVQLEPGQAAKLLFSNVSRGPAVDVVLLKLSYWWG